MVQKKEQQVRLERLVLSCSKSGRDLAYRRYGHRRTVLVVSVSVQRWKLSEDEEMKTNGYCNQSLRHLSLNEFRVSMLPF